MRTRKLIVLILALVIVLGGAYLLYNKLSGKFAPQQISGGNTVPAENSAENNSGESSHNYMAPDFTVYDAGGMPVKLSDYLGKPVIVNFWASWCGPCKSEMPEFEEAFKQYGDRIQFMMINLTFGSETESSAKSLSEASRFAGSVTRLIYFVACLLFLSSQLKSAPPSFTIFPKCGST